MKFLKYALVAIGVLALGSGMAHATGPVPTDVQTALDDVSATIAVVFPVIGTVITTFVAFRFIRHIK